MPPGMPVRGNIGWVDALRIISCFLVVFAHCCDPYVACFNTDYDSFLQGTAMGSLVRFCVPLFVMMSGVLLFPVRTGMAEFYKKRLGRIFVPLVFWSIALPLMYFVYLNYIAVTESPCINSSAYTWEMTLTKIYTFIFNFNYDTTPLWYLYMLLGLYFIIPIFSSWIDRASQKDIKLFLKLWGVSLFLPYIRMVAPVLGYTGVNGNMDILGCCDWNTYGTFYYVSGFIGYLILAYYLVKFPLQWSWKKIWAVSVPMFLVGYAVTFGGFVMMQEYFPGQYAYLEIIWWFAGINVFMMTFPVFIIVQKMNVASSPMLSRLASMTFGIYLCHFVFVQMGYDLVSAILPAEVPAVVRIFCIAVVSFAVSYVLVRVMSAFKLTRRLVA